jgi:hypothetical protein
VNDKDAEVMLTIQHSRAALIELAIAILGITGLTFGDHLLPSILWKVLAAIVLCIICGVVIIRRDRQVYRLRPNSPQLEKFFTKWYSNDGVLIVYCNDLEWASSSALKQALVLKASDKKLLLYLNAIGAQAEHLKSLGARVCKASALGTARHKFSILQTDGFSEIICRNKVIDGNTPGGLVVFISTNGNRDPHLIALAEDVLTQCPIIS